jgi:hypothetical protein
MTAQRTTRRRYFVCVNNDDYGVSLELRKIYEGHLDTAADRHDQVRIIDESGDDYIYPAHCFVRITLPHAVQQALKLAA